MSGRDEGGCCWYWRAWTDGSPNSQSHGKHRHSHLYVTQQGDEEINKRFYLLFAIYQEAVAREIGADRFVVSSSKESLEAATNSLDLILNTVSANHDLNLYLPLLVRSDLLIAFVSWFISGG